MDEKGLFPDLWLNLFFKNEKFNEEVITMLKDKHMLPKIDVKRRYYEFA